MLSRVLINDYYPDYQTLAMAIAEVLSEQVRDIEADFIQIDEASIGGHPQDIEWAVEAINASRNPFPAGLVSTSATGTTAGKRFRAEL